VTSIQRGQRWQVPLRPRRVLVVLLPDVHLQDMAGPVQVLYEASGLGGAYEITYCSELPRVRSAQGLVLTDLAPLPTPRRDDLVLVPGTLSTKLDRLVQLPRRWLREAHEAGAQLASVCSGAFALARAGLLDGRRCTTHWRNAAELARRYPAAKVDPDVLYVDEGQVLTSAGISAGIDLCLYLVRQDYGEHVAAEVAQRMVVANHRTGGQLQYAQRPLPKHGGLGATREWAISELQRPLTVRHLARHAGLPVRSFTRQFRDEVELSPMRWLTLQRVREALRLLEATDLDVYDVAVRSGFGTPATLRLHLARELGSTPTAYRRAHRRQ